MQSLLAKYDTKAYKQKIVTCFWGGNFCMNSTKLTTSPCSCVDAGLIFLIMWELLNLLYILKSRMLPREQPKVNLTLGKVQSRNLDGLLIYNWPHWSTSKLFHPLRPSNREKPIARPNFYFKVIGLGLGINGGTSSRAFAYCLTGQVRIPGQTLAFFWFRQSLYSSPASGFF